MITNKWINGSDDISDALKIRSEVFEKELKMTVEPEEDENDELSLHLVLYDEAEPCATGRIYHDGKTFRIGRCAVLKEKRGMGMGDMLVKLLLLKTFTYNPSEIVISSRLVQAPFYEKYGFVKTGEVYEEAGEPHIKMSVNKETLRFPSKCGSVKKFEDLFEERHVGE